MKIIDKLKNTKLAINCRTAEQAKEFLNICVSSNLTNYDYTSEEYCLSCWKVNKNQTCFLYYLGAMRYIDKTWAKEHDYKIITFNAFKNYIKEEKEMCSDGKLNKGIEGKLTQDVYRAVQKPNGDIVFNKVKMVNLCFVKFDGNEKIYIFKNPTDKRLTAGTKVLVDSCGREMVAHVVSSIKIQKKYVKDLMIAISGKDDLELKNVLGILEIQEVAYRFEV